MPEPRDPSDEALHKIEAKTAQPKGRTLLEPLLSPFKDLFGLSHLAATLSLISAAAILVVALYWFFRLAPPRSVVISSGAEGSAFQTNAVKYQMILARNGVELKILPSEGSLQNLQRLYDSESHVDIAFVQGGISNAPEGSQVISLGSVSYEPLFVFYRTNTTAAILSDFKGKRLAIGAEGSGTRALALSLLQLNGLTNGGSTILLDFNADKAAAALMGGDADAIFLTADSAPPQLMRKLLLDPGIQMLDFTQADAYTRRVSYLNKMVLPKGSLDFGRNIPARDVYVIGPTVELLARKDLHPALCDLLLEAGKEVHGRATLLQHKNEFPAPIEHEFPISPEASRYYKSGKSFFYRYLPFWLGSVVNRVLLVFVPVVVVMIPGLRMLPVLLTWKTRLRLLKWYRALLLLEYDLRGAMDEQKRAQVVARLDEIEQAVNRMKVPASFAGQFYSLREHIAFVRERLAAA
jgi:TRAP-type uncharacterized transport system substrate-binding protein